jgi:hypothetical protein
VEAEEGNSEGREEGRTGCGASDGHEGGYEEGEGVLIGEGVVCCELPVDARKSRPGDRRSREKEFSGVVRSICFDITISDSVCYGVRGGWEIGSFPGPRAVRMGPAWSQAGCDAQDGE